MPQAYVKKMATEYDISLMEAEEVWENAKDAAGKNADWAVVVTIFKKMLKERQRKYKK